MARIDFSRGYGEIFGSDDGAKYEQDGLLFDAAGDELATTKRGRKKISEVGDIDAQLEANLGTS